MKVGDAVLFLNEVGEGTIVEIQGAQILLEDSHGFEHWVTKTDLVLKDIDLNQLVNLSVPPHKEEENFVSKKHSKAHKSRRIVDLHLHELLENTVGMSNFQKLSYQVEFAKTKINEAQKQRVRFVVLIHGKGTGKLRGEIRKMLNALNIVDYYDVSLEHISGATEVQVY